MQKFMNRALAGAAALSLLCAGTAFADHGKGHGHGVKAEARGTMHANSVRDNDNDNDNHSKSHKARGNSSSAHSCVNPAGNTRGWCKSHMSGAFINGTVTAINGNMATVTLSNGQIVQVNEQFLLNQGRGLTVGQQVTLRGSWQNGVFVVNNGAYNNYGGPYTSASVRGLIISVNGNSVQIVQGLSLITVDVSNAAARGAISGTLLPGRTITAYGNWNGSTFVANSVQ